MMIWATGSEDCGWTVFIRWMDKILHHLGNPWCEMDFATQLAGFSHLPITSRGRKRRAQGLQELNNQKGTVGQIKIE